MREAVSRAHPGSVIQAVIERPDGTRVPIAIRLAPQRLHPASVSEWILDIALQLAFPLFCLILGYWVAAARPHDRNAWLLLALMISLEFLVPIGDRQEPWWLLSLIWVMLAGYAWPIFMMLFGVYFPERSAIDRRWPWVKWTVALLAVATSLVMMFFQLAKEYNFEFIGPLRDFIGPLDKVRTYVSMAAISVFFANLGEKSGTASNKDARRRIRLVLLGAGAGLTPSLIVLIIGLARGVDFQYGSPAWLL
jgi:sigma-B regulation protein RsbU (phosphoserine phosphatase)